MSLLNPNYFFINLNKWLNTPREKETKKLFAKYIDFIEIEITSGNF
ncbi:MAG: hypothetical protein L6V91_07165 [Bacilli bacterium]|nr:MAG: hypothetical protein L6V91_07165 [Bacilli bacterium]